MAQDKMIRFFRGIITFTLVLINVIIVVVTTIPIGLLRFVPIIQLQKKVLTINEALGALFLEFNTKIQNLMHNPNYVVKGQEKLKKDIWQFTTINHLSWADIFVFIYFTNYKQSVPRIFMKSQLWWLPLTWAAHIALAMPYVIRRTKAEIMANPKLIETDKNATRRSCKMYELMPTNVAGFIEGTRIDKAKYQASNSKFKNLMPPKIGGMGYTLEVMPYIDHLTDVTIVYKSEKREFWNFLCGDMREASVSINTYKIPEELRGVDYTNNQEMRDKLKAFLEQIWEEKDQIIDREKEKYGIESVF